MASLNEPQTPQGNPGESAESAEGELTFAENLASPGETPAETPVAAGAAPSANPPAAPSPATASPPAAAPAAAPDNLQIDAAAIEACKRLRAAIFNEMHKVIVGQEEVIEQMLLAMICRAHCLVVGVPGLAKTLIVRTLSQICHLHFKRIQFTPDLMPSDIIGTDILEEDQSTQKRAFHFIQGPIFTNLLLADEINRTPPKTQSALLEAMQEYRVTTSGTTYKLPLPFFVLATQNPLEQEGTYPLPEAQLDRFMFNVYIDYPEAAEEEEIIRQTTVDRVAEPQRVLGAKDILEMQRIVRRVPVSDHVIAYATRLARATRPKDPTAPDFIKNYISCGCGPRAGQYLILGAKAKALMDGRINVSCSDVRHLALPIMRHRMFSNFNASAEGVIVDDIVNQLLQTIPEPGEGDY